MLLHPASPGLKGQGFPTASKGSPCQPSSSWTNIFLCRSGPICWVKASGSNRHLRGFCVLLSWIWWPWVHTRTTEPLFHITVSWVQAYNRNLWGWDLNLYPLKTAQPWPEVPEVRILASRKSLSPTSGMFDARLSLCKWQPPGHVVWSLEWFQFEALPAGSQSLEQINVKSSVIMNPPRNTLNCHWHHK